MVLAKKTDELARLMYTAIFFYGARRLIAWRQKVLSNALH